MKVELFFLIIALLIPGCADRNIEDAPPNFLFIMYDDASWEHFGCYGDKAIKTPGTDRLAESGILFNNAYCAAPSCSPSRAGILTGQDIYRLEEASVLGGFLKRKFTLLPELLSNAGYSCGYTGKPYWPAKFDIDSANPMPTGPSYNIIRVINPLEGMTVWGDYTANFKIFLNQVEEDQPFFFWIGIQEPHEPWPPGYGIERGIDTSNIRIPGFLPDISDTRMDISDYMGEIMWGEDHIETIVNILEEKGLKDNTVIVVTSDNGMPLPRAKATLYDHGVRMPLIINWGDRIKTSRAIDNPVSLIDIAPTFLDLAGIDIPGEMTGRSLKNMILSDKSGTIENEREFVVSAIERHVFARAQRGGYPRRAIHTEGYTYIRNFEPDWWPAGDPDIIVNERYGPFGDCDPSRTKRFLVANGQNPDYTIYYNLGFGKVPGEQLFNKKNDPDMINNLADNPEYQDILKDLREKLTDYLKKTNDPRISRN